uniref:C-type lectin domain-containing protein n=1 Tax=Panagrolaimus superbus TaxID=310955 RepID=A0A914XZ95_9BILA
MSLKPQPHGNHFNWSNANYVREIPFICEVPRFPKAFCEPGWSLHMKSRSCFFLITLELNFHNAAMKCRSLSSNLASINDATENDLALKMIEKLKPATKVWFGLRWNAAKSNDAAIPPKTPYDKFYKYFIENMAYNVDGTPVSSYHYFDTATQPDGWRENIVENCVLYETDTRKWHDYNCVDRLASSLCRKMASTQPYKYGNSP